MIILLSSTVFNGVRIRSTSGEPVSRASRMSKMSECSPCCWNNESCNNNYSNNYNTFIHGGIMDNVMPQLADFILTPRVCHKQNGTIVWIQCVIISTLCMATSDTQRNTENAIQKGKYISLMQYPVIWTTQSTLHFMVGLFTLTPA